MGAKECEKEAEKPSRKFEAFNRFLKNYQHYVQEYSWMHSGTNPPRVSFDVISCKVSRPASSKQRGICVFYSCLFPGPTTGGYCNVDFNYHYRILFSSLILCSINPNRPKESKQNGIFEIPNLLVYSTNFVVQCLRYINA